MKCPRCGNENALHFGCVNHRYYCRKCIQFKRVFVDEERIVEKTSFNKHQVDYSIPFTLSSRQQVISNQLVKNYTQQVNSLVLAVCGSGKTEICFEVIKQALNTGSRVCFTIPRKALCQELYDRFKEAFKNIEIGLIYGGVKKNIMSDFIICTTHQLYQFVTKPFDLLLIDEADAFPFYQDEVLNAIFYQCTKRCYIKMSATLSQEDIHEEMVMVMNRRYHQHDLPVPRILLCPQCLWKLYLIYEIKRMLKRHEKILVYVPIKRNVLTYMTFLSHFFKVAGVSSSSYKINETIEALKEGKIQVLITTTILERGITIKNVQAIVVHASHPIFDERTLLQIAGRVGRKPGHEWGKIIFLDHYRSKEMKACIETITKLNKDAV